MIVIFLIIVAYLFWVMHQITRAPLPGRLYISKDGKYVVLVTSAVESAIPELEVEYYFITTQGFCSYEYFKDNFVLLKDGVKFAKE